MYSLYSRAPQVFGTLARKDSVFVKLFIFLTRKGRIIKLSLGELILAAYDDEVKILLYFLV